MATAAMPIRELSATVQLNAASAQKAFWEVMESKQRETIFVLLARFLTHRLNRRLARLLKSQSELIEALRQISVEELSAAEFTRVADELSRIVGMTDSMILDCYDMHEICVGAWRTNLEKVSDQSGHLESFAESFKMAADQTCTALLASIAQKVVSRDPVAV
jgi:hypothetical protein